MNRRFGRVFIAFAVLGFILAGFMMGARSQEYDVHAKIEARRKDGLINLRFELRPEENAYFIVNERGVIGTVSLLEVVPVMDGVRVVYRAHAAYSLEREEDRALIRAGLSIGLRKRRERIARDYTDPKKLDVERYRREILSPIDNREMILVQEGKFIFGANGGQKDEAPEQMIDLPSFYIDRYEVSNAEYARFLRETNSKPPRTWTEGKYRTGEDDLPVIVSYYEAEAYARWAHKRLPTEQEWEKAARGPGFEYVKEERETRMVRKPLQYPWGSSFDPARANCLEFWSRKGMESDLPASSEKGLLPVQSFRGTGDSPYGAVNMAGNAPEWTSSWYRAYPGSRHRDGRYGTQLKVLRGGAWYQGGDQLRVSARGIGGIPNLYVDAVGGIRCVKSPLIVDRER